MLRVPAAGALRRETGPSLHACRLGLSYNSVCEEESFLISQFFNPKMRFLTGKASQVLDSFCLSISLIVSRCLGAFPAGLLLPSAFQRRQDHVGLRPGPHGPLMGQGGSCVPAARHLLFTVPSFSSVTRSVRVLSPPWNRPFLVGPARRGPAGCARCPWASRRWSLGSGASCEEKN